MPGRRRLRGPRRTRGPWQAMPVPRRAWIRPVRACVTKLESAEGRARVPPGGTRARLSLQLAAQLFQVERQRFAGMEARELLQQQAGDVPVAGIARQFGGTDAFGVAAWM